MEKSNFKITMTPEEIEVLYVSGQMKESLDESRLWLVEQLHLDPEIIAERTTLELLSNEIYIGEESILDDETERVLAIFMQAVFESSSKENILLLADTLRISSPIPYHIGLYWGTLLIAENLHELAKSFIEKMLGDYALKIQTPQSDNALIYSRYEHLFFILVSHIWIHESTNNSNLIYRIKEHKILHETSKLKLIDYVTTHINPQDEQSREVYQQDVPQPTYSTSRKQITHAIPTQSILAEPSTQIMIGAAAIAAVCAIKYRSNLQASMGDVMSALNEAKGLFFG